MFSRFPQISPGSSLLHVDFIRKSESLEESQELTANNHHEIAILEQHE